MILFDAELSVYLSEQNNTVLRGKQSNKNHSFTPLNEAQTKHCYLTYHFGANAPENADAPVFRYRALRDINKQGHLLIKKGGNIQQVQKSCPFLLS